MRGKRGVGWEGVWVTGKVGRLWRGETEVLEEGGR